MKKLLYILAGIALLTVLGLIVLIVRLDPIVEGFRPEITKKASEALGAKVEIGEIKSSIFPTIGFSLSGITVGEKGLVNADLVSVKSSLADLLSGKISVEDIVVQGVNLPIEKKPDGTIQIGEITLGGKPENPEEEKSVQPKRSTTQPKETKAEPQKLQIKSVGLEDINLSYKDPSTKIAIKNLGGSIKDIDSTGSANLDLTADLFSGKFGIKGAVGNPMARKPLDFTTSLTNINLAELPLPPLEGVTLSDRADVKAKLKSAALAFDAELDLDFTSSSVKYKELFAKPTGYNLTLDTKALVPILLSKGSTNVERLEATIGKSTISATAVVGKEPTINIKKANIDLANLSQVIPMLKDYELKGALMGNIDVKKANPPSLYGSLKLDKIALTKGITVSDITGDLDFKGQEVNSDNLSLNVAGNKVNIGLSTKSLIPASATVDVKSESFNLSEFNLPGSKIEGLDVNADYRQKPDELLAKIKLTGGSLKDIPLGQSSLDVVKKRNTVTLKVEPFGIAQGEITGVASVTLGDKLSLKLKGSGLELEALTKAISGTVQSLTVSLQGKQTEDMVNTLRGPVSLDVGPGEITGVNILKDVAAALSTIPGVSDNLNIDPKLLSADGTAFDSLSVKSSLNSGLINISSVKLDHSLYQVTSSGTATISGKADLKASFSLKEAIANSLIAKEPKLKLAQDKSGSIVVPITIRKEGDKTRVLPDVEQLLSRAAKNTAKEAASRELDKVAPGAGKILDSLF